MCRGELFVNNSFSCLRLAMSNLAVVRMLMCLSCCGHQSHAAPQSGGQNGPGSIRLADNANPSVDRNIASQKGNSRESIYPAGASVTIVVGFAISDCQYIQGASTPIPGQLSDCLHPLDVRIRKVEPESSYHLATINRTAD